MIALVNPFTQQVLNSSVPNPRGCNQHTGPGCSGTYLDVGHGVTDDDNVDAYVMVSGQLLKKRIAPEGSVKPPGHEDLFDEKSLSDAQAKGRIDHIKKRISVIGKRAEAVVKILERRYPDYDVFGF